MAQTDLYPILRAYANKNNSPFIDIDTFLEFLEKYARHKAENSDEWVKWTRDVEIKFWSEMAALTESGKCTLMANTPEGRIYMPFYYADLLQETYRSMDNSADRPFPSEETLHIVLPEEEARLINLSSDLPDFFNGGKREMLPVIKLIFPEDGGSALVLAPMIPGRLMEAALLKMRHYLRSHGNRDYAYHKLAPQFQGKEKYLKDILDQILIRPTDCIAAMESYGDFSWLFWAVFCSLVKNDIKKKKELLSEDTAALQAAYIIETCNSIYKARAVKQREKETAFRELDLHLEKPPFYFTLEQITRFTNSKGTLLLGRYSQEDLEEYIRKKTTESGKGSIPEWLVLQGKGEKWYIKKDKYLPLCSRLLIDTRPLVKKAVTSRWAGLIKNFRVEAAMENDADFERLLSAFTAKLAPILMALLEDKKLLWVYEEMEQTHGGVPPSSRIFERGRLVPMSALYVLRRKELLTDARILLPFWYSIPILSAIIVFFKNLGKGKKRAKGTAEETEETGMENREEGDIKSAAKKAAEELVPMGKTLDSFLAELENRWSRLLDKQARANLLNDVNALVRDNLRHSIRIHKTKKINREGLEEIATGIVSHNPALQSLGGQDSLHMYMELYMVKLLLDTKTHPS
ncbi:MAG: hypothetical protein LBG42_06545 [Treponema sp.]|jgi:hypothetical protein|nr:hypothetical protein [Treponema sp.]